MYYNGALYFTVGGATKLLITSGAGNTYLDYFGIRSDVADLAMGAGSDLHLMRDAANILGQRNSTTAQTFRLYTSYTSGTSYERLGINTAAGSITLAAETLDAGTDNIDIILTPAGTGQIKTTLSDNNAGHAITINANQAGVTASDTFINFLSTTGSEGSIAGTAVAGVLAYNTFTGSHYTTIVGDRTGLTAGTVLEMTGNLVGEWPDKSYTETVDVTEEKPITEKIYDVEGKIIEEKPVLDSEGKPEVVRLVKQKDILHDLRAAPKKNLAETRICATKGSKAVYGVYGGTDKEGRDTVLALGTGVILVINTGKNIQAGDFLISSATKGYSELQADDIYRNSTVAKATQNVVWKIGETSKLIACVYLGG